MDTPPKPKLRTLSWFLQLSQPLPVLAGVVAYALGGGIAHYLGAPIQWPAYFYGQLWVILAQLSSHYLQAYYSSPFPITEENTSRKSTFTYFLKGYLALGVGRLSRRAALVAALTCLAFLASLTVGIEAQFRPGLGVYLVMMVSFLILFSYATPPLRLETSGLGELALSVWMGFLVPALAFLIQRPEIHRLVAISGLPLVAAHLAMLLTFSLADYAIDVKYLRGTLLVRLGWENGVLLHNALIGVVYLLLLLALAMGYPRFAFLAGLLTLPLGLFQVVQMRAIVGGAKPNWNALTLGGMAYFGLLTYFLAFAFWTN